VPPCGGHLLASCRSRCTRYGCQRRCLAAFGQILGSEQGGICGEISMSGVGRPGLPLPTFSSTRGVGAWGLAVLTGVTGRWASRTVEVECVLGDVVRPPRHAGLRVGGGGARPWMHEDDGRLRG
jgi:hypothetical protein